MGTDGRILDDQAAQLESAIAAQEAQRAVLGDAVVDITVKALRTQLDALQAKPRGSGVAGATAHDLSALLQRHIPENLAEKLRAVGRIDEERRQVTVVFADITGFTALCEEHDQEEVAAFTDAILRELSEAVYLHEGYVDKFIGDAVMAVFGAPLAHEDDEERALRATLEMRKRIEALDLAWRGRLGRSLELHVGVNTGEVIAGWSGIQMSYRVIGDTVNTASRLGDAAPPGKIYVSRNTYRLTREAFSFLAMEPIRVKNKAKPVVVYELERAKLDYRKARGLTDLETAFVGREEQLAVLGRVAEGLRRGRGRIVAVSGEAGIGKSRLMDEWRDRLRTDGSVNWVEGRCLPFTSAQAYGPFLDLMRRFAGIDEEQSEEAARRRLDLAVGRFFPGDAEARAVFANLMGLVLGPSDLEVLQAIPAKKLRDRLVALVEAIFTTLASDCPTILVIEDMHWADSASFDLLEHLFVLAERLPLAIAMVSRPEPSVSRVLAALRERQAAHFTDITLAALTEAGAVEMATRLLSLAELPQALRELVVRRAEGNPFYVEEMIRSLIDQGALVRAEEGGWKTGTALGRVTVPDSLQGLLMARLDRLPPETRQLAQRAAVIGRIFLYRILRRLGEDERDIDEDLGRMEREDLIRERAIDPELEYMFRHALTQEVAYESLLASRRAQLHRRVGETMEQLFAGRIGEFTRVIGEHFLKGEAWAKAADYLVRSGDAAARLYANAEARADYIHALQALERLSEDTENCRRRVDTTLRLARVSFMGVSPQALLERLEEAERLAAALPGPDGAPGGDRLRLAHVHYQIGLVHFTANRMREAVGYYSKVLAVAADLKAPELLDMPSFSIGSVLVFQGNFGKGRHLLGQAIPALEKNGEQVHLGRAKALHGWAAAMMGDFAAALQESEWASDLAQRLGSLYLAALSSTILCAVHLYQDFGPEGQRRAEDATRNAIEAATSAGDQGMEYTSRGVRAWWLAMVERFDEAAEEMERCLALAAKLGGQLVMIDHLTARSAVIAHGQGRREEARALVQKAVEISRRSGGIWAEAYVGRAMAKILATDSPPDFAGAEAQLARSLQLYESGQNLMGLAHTEIDWGGICRLRGDDTAAREHYGKAVALFESKGIAKRAAQVRALMES